jgi:endogenous inhibitor of DNA gyrase (YacG/DUF329 family)
MVLSAPRYGGEAQMNRCGHCRGKFGLVRQRWYEIAFCSKRCREKYLDKMARDRDFIKRWFGSAQSSQMR